MAAIAAVLLGVTSAAVGCLKQDCTSNETLCSPDGGATYCANTQTDSVNCGICGVACMSGQLCAGGQCLTCGAMTACSPDGGAVYCANIQTDNANCGACGNICDAGQMCSSGQCTANCAAPMVECSGECTSVGTDPTNCGDCGATCGTANATAFCSAGACGLACQTGFADCDSTNANGCEVQTDNDVDNCGHCGVACDTSAGSMCIAGECIAWLNAQPWTESSSGTNAALGNQALSGASAAEQFTYSDTTTDGSGAEQLFTFQAIAESSFTLNYAWQYAGNHADDESTASLQAFADGPVATTTVTLAASQSVSGDFSFSGTSSIAVVSGYAFGFMARGQSFASNSQLIGTISITEQ